MPRKVRVEYPGAIYHIMSRGDRREDIFHDEVDRQDFLKTLAETCLKADFQVHAYCLMSNHFHLVLETPNGNLVAGMRWLLSSYTLRLNHRRKLTGHVFSGRYKAIKWRTRWESVIPGNCAAKARRSKLSASSARNCTAWIGAQRICRSVGRVIRRNWRSPIASEEKRYFR